MMISENNLEQEVIEGLLGALRKLPINEQEPSVTAPRSDIEIDAEIEFSAGGGKYILLVIIGKSVYPRDAQRVFWRFDRYMVSTSFSYRREQIVPLLAAESISLGAKEFLKSENFGFFDSAGSLFIPARGAYVYVERLSSRIFQKSMRSLFTGRRSQVLHALLLRHNEWFSVKELAQFAEVSSATVSEMLPALERFDWLVVKGQGPFKKRRLTNPSALLDEWQRQQPTAASRRQIHRRFYVPSSNPDDIAHRLDYICEKLDIKYALTEQSAAQIYAPFLTSVSRLTCRLELGLRMNDLYAELEARAVNEGANLEVIETDSSGDFLFGERVNKVWLASPVQVYLDLLRSDGRSKEMAEHLRRERIGF